MNRGGLYELNDVTYLFFKALEVQTQNVLPQRLKNPSVTMKEQVYQSILKDENVQNFWGHLSVDINDEDLSQELLQEIVRLWVTIRGWSNIKL